MASLTSSKRLQDKVCIVTGSSSGLGRAISLAYSHEGATIVCVDLKPEARIEVSSECAVQTHELIQQQHGKAIFIRADLSSSGDVESVVHQAVAEYGRI